MVKNIQQNTYNKMVDYKYWDQASGQFAKIDYQPPMDLRDFYVFPYDMRHCAISF